MGYDGRSVANFILDYCDRRGRKITNLALQKIVYFCHVWHLIQLGRPLVKHQFEAWQYGPVLQYLYREFKDYDSAPILKRSMEIDREVGGKKLVSYHFDRETEDFLASIVEFYSRMRAGDLVELSHAEGGPWGEVWNHRGTVNPGMRIGNDRIVAYYSKVPKPFPTQ